MADHPQIEQAPGVQPRPTLRVTWIKSAIGYNRDQKETIRSLGLRRLHQTVEVPDNPAIRGMVFKVKHLIAVEETK